MKNVITIVSWNVNGLRAIIKKGALDPVISQLQPDWLCLQETKSFPQQVEIDYPQFIEYWNPSQTKKGYSGTANFTQYSPYSVFYDLPEEIEKKYKLHNDPFGNPNNEGRVITLEYKWFYLVNVYTPNAKPDLARLELRHKKWDPAFTEYVTSLDKQKPVIVCGDFNVAHTPLDLARPETNEGSAGFTKQEREGIDNFIKAGFVDSFRKLNKNEQKYTWWSYQSGARERNVGWRIDYIFVSKTLEDTIEQAEIHNEFHGSDHCPVSIKLNLDKIK